MHKILRRDAFGTSPVPVAAQIDTFPGLLPPHSHDFTELAIVRAGKGTHHSAAGSAAVGAGAVVILRPGDWHSYSDCAGITVFNVYIGSELFGNELAWLRKDSTLGHVLWPVSRSRWPEGDRIIRLGKPAQDRLLGPLRGLEAPHTNKTGERAHRIGLLLCVLSELAPFFGSQPQNPPDEVVRAVALLENEPNRKWTLQQVCAEVSVSQAHLVRLFAIHIGAPPMECLNRLRAENAAALLIETDLQVSAIGRRVGWSDPNYASRRFKAFFGISPLEYRARYHP